MNSFSGKVSKRELEIIETNLPRVRALAAKGRAYEEISKELGICVTGEDLQHILKVFEHIERERRQHQLLRTFPASTEYY